MFDKLIVKLHLHVVSGWKVRHGCFWPHGDEGVLKCRIISECKWLQCYGSNRQDNPEGSRCSKMLWYALRCSEHYVIFFDTQTSLLITFISLSSLLRNLAKIRQAPDAPDAVSQPPFSVLWLRQLRHYSSSFLWLTLSLLF